MTDCERGLELFDGVGLDKFRSVGECGSDGVFRGTAETDFELSTGETG